MTYGQGRPGAARPRGGSPGEPAARRAPDADRGRRQGPPPRPPERVPGADAGVTESGLPLSGLPSSVARVAGSAAAAAARPYGRILIFTLLDDRVADFDRLAEESAEYVRTGEPDTLVYVIHLVPNAPLQRIFYEIYRDRAAFDSHESQPYMQRFVAERRTCVLATNVIELRLKYAKVAPLPGPPLPGPPPLRRRPLPGGAAAGPVRCPRPARSVPIRSVPASPATASPATASPGTASPATASRAPTGNATTSGGPTHGRFRRVGPMAASVARITLLGRPGCHLCDDARAVIERVAADLGVGWEERDITASPDDMREYWDKIPVTLVDGVQIDFWRVSEARLRAALG